MNSRHLTEWKQVLSNILYKSHFCKHSWSVGEIIPVTCTPRFVLKWPERICVRWFQCFLWRNLNHDRMTPFLHRAGLMKGECVLIPNDRILFWRVQIWYHIASSVECVCACVHVLEFTVFLFFCITLNCPYCRNEWENIVFLL